MEFNFNLRAERTRAKNQHYFNFKLYLLNHQNNFKLKLFFVNSECNFQLIQFQWPFFSRRASRAEKNTQIFVIFSFIDSFLLVKLFRCAAGENVRFTSSFLLVKLSFLHRKRCCVWFALVKTMFLWIFIQQYAILNMRAKRARKNNIISNRNCIFHEHKTISNQNYIQNNGTTISIVIISNVAHWDFLEIRL